MKRRSGQHRPDKRKLQRPDDSSGPFIREGTSFTQLELLPNQVVTLTGSAVLEVTSGCIAVYGALFTPDDGPITLHAPARFGRALQLTAMAADAEPPCQASSKPALAVLQGLHGQQQQQQQGYTMTNAAATDAASAWQVPGPWAQAIGDLSSAAAAAAAAAAGRHDDSSLCVAVTGSKGSGKSAFARLLVNTLLSQGHGVVAYLDLDPGQPEFTPPGLLSLQLLFRPVFGPAHLQHQQPLLAFFQGDTSPQSEPGRYLQAVQALLHRYSRLSAADLSAAAGPPPAAPAAGRDGSGMCADVCTSLDGGRHAGLQLLPPLVINTPGWITGLGLDLLAEVLRCAVPTHVVQLQTSNPKKNLPAASWWLNCSSTAAGSAAPAAAPLPSVAAAASGGIMPVLLQVPSVLGPAVEAPNASAAAAAADGTLESVVSGASGDTTLTQAAAGGQGSTKGVSAAAARSLNWLAWAERVAAANGNTVTAADSWHVAARDGRTAPVAAAVAAEDVAAVAEALAAAVPRVASLNELQIVLLHAEFASGELPVALNGAVVGLCTRSSISSRASTCAGRSCKQEPGVCGHEQQGQELPECLGLGLVRSVNGPRAELYLLTDLPDQQLARVKVLQLGKLELPDRLLECRSCASPYQGLFCLASAAAGAGQIKSRNNLLRSSQLLR